ncbi:NAD(P)-dependent oxidoreductase [Parvularcula lutaonensis]|uniref:NAD(P)-dependent oxidoreductase n=1 Tax=Parvularcula lutaonensis TaxID=491923 RepID=A0ABV7MEZ1_9PROT|nr:NAD(P)H-binding protein [Parvularcula lutaonensis]GGY52989.1 hypothetical protein GCM10007148_22770 [Parvularcula lutaonensis]
MTDPNHDIVVFGASGVTGQHVLRQARHRDLRVLAVHHTIPEGARDDDRITHASADVLSDDLADLCALGRSIISCLGVAFSPSAAIDPPPLYSKGTKAIIDGMRRAARNRLAVISAAFVDHQEILPDWFRASVIPALGAIIDDMRAMERTVEECGLAWTIARPGWLLDRPKTDDYEVGDGVLHEGCLRTRNADLAEVMLMAVADGRWVGGRPSPARHESDFDESPAALAREFGTMAVDALKG